MFIVKFSNLQWTLKGTALLPLMQINFCFFCLAWISKTAIIFFLRILLYFFPYTFLIYSSFNSRCRSFYSPVWNYFVYSFLYYFKLVFGFSRARHIKIAFRDGRVTLEWLFSLKNSEVPAQTFQQGFIPCNIDAILYMYEKKLFIFIRENEKITIDQLYP